MVHRLERNTNGIFINQLYEEFRIDRALYGHRLQVIPDMHNIVELLDKMAVHTL